MLLSRYSVGLTDEEEHFSLKFVSSFLSVVKKKRAGFFSVGQVSVPLIWSQEREPETLKGKEKKVSE